MRVGDGVKINLARSMTKTPTTSSRLFEDAPTEAAVVLGVGWVEDLTDPDAGEIGTACLVTDTGPAPRAAGSPPGLPSVTSVTIRTRKKAP